ncbi:MAG TPA: 1-acyl-sn-glycerol-3-phosphate acyltransferase [Pseudomonadales bacterium]
MTALPIPTTDKCQTLADALHLPAAAIQLDSNSQCANLPFNAVGDRHGEPAFAALEVARKPWQGSCHDNSLEAYIHDQSSALVSRFFRRVVLENPAAMQQCHERPVLYLANHQTGIESLLFMLISHWLTGTPVCALAKDKHSDSFYGTILAISRLGRFPVTPVELVFASRENAGEMLATFGQLQHLLASGQRSVLIHVEGTRALQAGQPVQKFSAINLDLAEKAGAMIVPVRFTGGLPLQASTEKQEFPWQFGQQDCYIGSPIAPQDLRPLLLKDRIAAVCERINRLGPPPGCEQPLNADPGYLARAEDYARRHQLALIPAVFAIELAGYRPLSKASRELLDCLQDGRQQFSDPRMLQVASRLFGKNG